MRRCPKQELQEFQEIEAKAAGGQSECARA
jgi:hypothetical protein